MSTDPYWRIICDQQKFYDFELMKAEAQQRMIESDTDTIECDITKTIGRIHINTPLTLKRQEGN